MHNYQNVTEKNIVLTTVKDLNAEICNSLDELASVCGEQLSHLDIEKFKERLIPKLKLVLNGLQNGQDALH